MEKVSLAVSRRRLTKLAKYLVKLSPEYNAEHFRMSTFYRHNDEEEFPSDAIDTFKHHICGTAACAIGHIPVVFPELTREVCEGSYSYSKNDVWRALSGAVLGIGMSEIVWEFLFGADWGYRTDKYQRTSWAVADRIAYYLDGDYRQASIRSQGTASKYRSAEKGWTTKEQLVKNEEKFTKLLEEEETF